MLGEMLSRAVGCVISARIL